MHQSMVRKLVWGWNGKPRAIQVSRAAAAIVANARRARPQPPAIRRSIIIIASIIAVGTRSKPVMAIQNPAMPVSTSRLRYSVRRGCRDTSTRRQASSGQHTALSHTTASTQAGWPCPASEEATPKAPATKPSARIRAVCLTNRARELPALPGLSGMACVRCKPWFHRHEKARLEGRAFSISNLAAPDGFEPPNAGVRVRGLTTWRRGCGLEIITPGAGAHATPPAVEPARTAARAGSPPGAGSALGELRGAAGLVQADLLALDLAGVAGHEAGLAQVGLQRLVVLDQGAGDAQADRTGLAGGAAA